MKWVDAYMGRKKRALAGTLVLVSTIWLAILASVKRFGSPDDFCTYAASIFMDGCMGVYSASGVGFFDASLSQAKSQGRFYQLMYYSLAQIMIASPLISHMVKFLTVVALCLVLWRLVYKLFDRNYANFSVILFSFTYPATGAYNALTSFPGWFAIGVIAWIWFLGDMFEFINEKNQLKMSRKIIFNLSICISLLSYESIIVMLLATTLFLLFLRARRQTNFENVQFMMKSIAFCTSSYLISFVIFKSLYPGSYSGTDIAPFNLILIANSLFKLSFAGIFNIGFSGALGLSVSTVRLLIASSLIMLIFLIILVILFSFTAKTGKKVKFDGSAAFLFLFLTLAPNILLAITARYQNWIRGNPMYIGYLASHIAFIIFIMYVFRYVSKHRLVLKTAILSNIALLVIFSINTNIVYLKDSIEKNSTLRKVEKVAISANLKGALDEAKAKQLNEAIGAYPYRYVEAFVYRNNK